MCRGSYDLYGTMLTADVIGTSRVASARPTVETNLITPKEVRALRANSASKEAKGKEGGGEGGSSSDEPGLDVPKPCAYQDSRPSPSKQDSPSCVATPPPHQAKDHFHAESSSLWQASADAGRKLEPSLAASPMPPHLPSSQSSFASITPGLPHPGAAADDAALKKILDQPNPSGKGGKRGGRGSKQGRKPATVANAPVGRQSMSPIEPSAPKTLPSVRSMAATAAVLVLLGSLGWLLVHKEVPGQTNLGNATVASPREPAVCRETTSDNLHLAPPESLLVQSGAPQQNSTLSSRWVLLGGDVLLGDVALPHIAATLGDQSSSETLVYRWQKDGRTIPGADKP